MAEINNRFPIKNIRLAKPTMGAMLVCYNKDPDETVTTGGIILPQKQELFIVEAEVVQTSEAYASSGQKIDLAVKVGDMIIVEKRSGINLGKQEDGKLYKVINPKDVVLVLPS